MVKKRVRDIKRRDEEMEKNSRQVLQRQNKGNDKRKLSSDEFAAQKDFVKLDTTTGTPQTKKQKGKAVAPPTEQSDFSALRTAVESERLHEKTQSEAKVSKAPKASKPKQKADAVNVDVADLQRDFTLDKGTTDKISSSVAALPIPAMKPSRGVIYLGHIPHGFFEPQMKAFFSQFGAVKNLRLFRNEKTGRSRQYAFIEFENIDIAKIVAETMDGYILFERTLKSEVIPSDKIKRSVWLKPPRSRLYRKTRPAAVKKHNAPKTEGKIKKNQKTMIAKETKKREALEKLGISYDFPGYSALVADAKGAANERVKKEEPKKQDVKKEEPKKQGKKVDATIVKADHGAPNRAPQAKVTAKVEEKQTTAKSQEQQQQPKAKSETNTKQSKKEEALSTVTQIPSAPSQATPKKTKAARK